MEHEESGIDALVRELHEQLGGHVTDLPTSPTVAISDDALDIDLAIWLVDAWHGEPSNRQPDEHNRIAWFTTPDLADIELADDRYRALLLDALRSG